METLFWLALGLFIGWNIPQPTWAKIITNVFWTHFKRQSSKNSSGREPVCM